ncbi:hypothetical protein ACYATO_08025, partial [Lactobacillaceae bacterium Melli_B3]
MMLHSLRVLNSSNSANTVAQSPANDQKQAISSANGYVSSASAQTNSASSYATIAKSANSSAVSYAGA